MGMHNVLVDIKHLWNVISNIDMIIFVQSAEYAR